MIFQEDCRPVINNGEIEQIDGPSYYTPHPSALCPENNLTRLLKVVRLQEGIKTWRWGFHVFYTCSITGLNY